MRKEKSYLELVQKGIDYIEANLDFDISLAEVANNAAISQWHFQRVFKALTNETLKTYIRSRRLAKSLDKLITTRFGILEISIAAGYESQESFTRSFRKAFDLTPNEYRKLGKKSLFLKKVEFNEEYLKHINQNMNFEPEIVVIPRMMLLGLTTQFYGVDSEKNNIGEKLPPLWEIFLSRLSEVPNRVPGPTYGVVSQSKTNPELLEYCAAVEVSNMSDIPSSMTGIEVPGSEYAVFEHRGQAKQVDKTVDYIYSSWLIQSGRKHSYSADLEIYDERYHATSENSLMHYAIPLVV